MNTRSPSLADSLADDLTPVRPVRLFHGALLVAVAVGATVALVAWIDGLWRGAIGGEASAFYFLTNGMLAMIGVAAAAAAVRIARPRVGPGYEGLAWTGAMLAVLPLAALAMLGFDGLRMAAAQDAAGPVCFVTALASGTLTAGALAFWLRRGAPVSLAAAGWLTGVAAGALGSLTYGLACPVDSMSHLAVWHLAPVVVSALAGRMAIPPLVRW